MFTKQVIQHTIWSRQKHNGFPIASRSVPVNFSLGLRSSLVRLSLLIRQSIEDRTRTERGTSKKRTKEQRISIEMPTRNYRQLDDSHLHGWQNTLLQPQTSILPLTLLLPRQIAALSAPPRTFSRRIKPFPPILHIPPTHIKSPVQALKTPHYHTAQRPPKTHPTRPKHPLTST